MVVLIGSVITPPPSPSTKEVGLQTKLLFFRPRLWSPYSGARRPYLSRLQLRIEVEVEVRSFRHASGLPLNPTSLPS